jgi:uncharacterized protein HemY
MAKQINAVEFNLSPAEEAAAQRIYQSLKGKADQQLMNMARMLAAKEPRELLGPAQFELRDMLNELGANVLEASTHESLKKGGTSS